MGLGRTPHRAHCYMGGKWSMELVGRTLGQFQIVAQIGKGGMAAVYRAYQTNLQRYVALKVLSPRLADDLELVKRFLREARSAAALRHPNVMIIHDVGSEGDLHYIVSELLDGITLAQLLQQEGALPPERVLNIARQVSSALDYAHSRGYIHRDIKPSNTMIDPDRDDHVTLMDFGLVQVAGGSRITRAGFIMGTPDYMSPEQAKGDPVDHRTDVYSLGVTLYHALTGTVPFVKSTPHAILLAHIMEDPPDMSGAEHRIPGQVEAVVRKAVAKDPRDRYEWAGDLAADLEMAIHDPESFVVPDDKAPVYPYDQTATRAQPSSLAGETAWSHTRGPATSLPYTAGGPAQTQAPPSVPAERRPASWVWPVVGLASFALVAILAILGILFWPQIRPLGLAAQPTATAEPTATQTPDPEILYFDASPAEIVQGESVTLSWRVTGADSVAIHPGVLEKGLIEDTVVHQPAETTTYRLELPGGIALEAQVIVLPAPLPPVIEYFTVDPPEQVRGQEFTLSWQVSGDADRIEISGGTERIGVSATDQLTLVAQEATTYVLNAYNGDLVSTAEIQLQIIEPTPTGTPTPLPTAVPTQTPTPQPTATATMLPSQPPHLRPVAVCCSPSRIRVPGSVASSRMVSSRGAGSRSTLAMLRPSSATISRLRGLRTTLWCFATRSRSAASQT
jgi:serine/threonine protein kinase